MLYTAELLAQIEFMVFIKNGRGDPPSLLADDLLLPGELLTIFSYSYNCLI
jgi:hypothetical protein